MDFDQFLQSSAFVNLQRNINADSCNPTVDLSRAASIDIGRDIYNVADSRGMTLSELLELDGTPPFLAQLWMLLNDSCFWLEFGSGGRHLQLWSNFTNRLHHYSLSLCVVKFEKVRQCDRN